MARFDPKYPGKYDIARASITFSIDLLTFFWNSFDE